MKTGGWKTILSYWVSVTFQGLFLLNFGRGTHYKVDRISSAEKKTEEHFFQIDGCGLLMVYFTLPKTNSKSLWK